MENHSGPFEPKKTSIVWTWPNSLTGFCSRRGMNKEESKVKIAINYGKSFLRVSPKTMVDYYNDFKLHQFSPSGSAFKFFGAKRMLLQAPETQLNCQEIVYLARISDILDNIFTGGLEMSNLMTVRLLHFCTQAMGSRRSSQTPGLLFETVVQVDEIPEESFSCFNLD